MKDVSGVVIAAIAASVSGSEINGAAIFDTAVSWQKWSLGEPAVITRKNTRRQPWRPT